MLEVGMKAPAFTLPDQNGNSVSLSDFAGKKVVLYFYPKDNTPGCTRQACAFAQNYAQFQAKDVMVIGISKDSTASHLKFAQKYELPFVLLSDPERQAIEAYGVWQEKKLYGKVSMGVVRSTYLINEQGVIEKVMPKVKPDSNAEQILAYLNGEE
ncbi:MAG: thioredoxin-dependent thiol peroxidase [Negativibacillus sp.]